MKTSTAIRRGAAAVLMGGVAVGAFAVPANAVPVSTWDALAQCESGGNWGTNTGNGFSGGLQFTPSTWAAFGGTGSAQGASKAEQIRVAENVLQGQGWGAWPACSASLGLNSAPTNRDAQAAQPAPAPEPAPAPAPTPAPAVSRCRSRRSSPPICATATSARRCPITALTPPAPSFSLLCKNLPL